MASCAHHRFAMWEDLLSEPEPEDVLVSAANSPPTIPTRPAGLESQPPAKAAKRQRADVDCAAAHGHTAWTRRLLSTETLQTLISCLTRPVRVHTACSGTGAPVWALKAPILLLVDSVEVTASQGRQAGSVLRTTSSKQPNSPYIIVMD